MSNTAMKATGTNEDRVDANIQRWKQKLLDLSKRNRALNFKPTKVSTLVILGNEPAEVLSSLVVRKRSIRFAATLLSSSRTGADVSTEELDDEVPSIRSSEQRASSLDRRSRSGSEDLLDVVTTPEALDRSLRRLDEQARETLEEQGVNVLFLGVGMLHYTESPDSKERIKAPLIMVPVSLSRKNARSEYAIRVTEDDPMVNPALAEYLRRSFSVNLPELPQETDDGEVDYRAFFVAVIECLSARGLTAGSSAWEVRDDIVLGVFSFQKLVMFKDLEVNTAAFARHRLIRQLITKIDSRGGASKGLPDDVRLLSLDEHFPPEVTAQVVDADSSQLRAIAAVARGHDLVLEGPPGTGKSQTITNLIAQTLQAGKSVLFVAEKMAALEVVHRRLVEAGLGEFCLELHSTKANKKAVIQQLAQAWDASLERPRIEAQTHRLPTTREALNTYVRALHAPTGRFQHSPFAVIGMLGELRSSTPLTYRGPSDSLTRVELDEVVRRLQELALHAAAIGDPTTHPWRGTRRTYYPRDVLDTLQDLFGRLIERCERFESLASAILLQFKLPVRGLPDVQRAVRVAELLARSPGAPLAVLTSEKWNQPPAETKELIERGRRIQALRTSAEARFSSAAFEHLQDDDIAYMEQKSRGFFGFLAVFDGRYRATKKRWNSWRVGEAKPSLSQQIEELREVSALQKERALLEQSHALGQELFGALWKSEGSNWAELEAYVDWVVEVRVAAVTHAVQAETLEAAINPRPDLSLVHELATLAKALESELSELRTLVDLPSDELARTPISDVRRRLEDMRATISRAPGWASFEVARQAAVGTRACDFVHLAMNGGVSFESLSDAFQRAYLQRWLDDVVISQPVLRDFHAVAHEQRIAEFRELDRRILTENKTAIVAKLRETTQRKLKEESAVAGLPFLRREMAKQRNLSPLRKTIQVAEPTIRAIKPCFMMSPLTVSQYLSANEPSFDVVIFDEASQLTSEDAVGAIVRGRQLVVVGDPKQLPPTNFFAIAGAGADAPVDEDGLPLYEDAESVLEEFQASGVSSTRLKWHYRSAHESLIAFSNASFYDADLYTFPSAETDRNKLGLSFEYLPDGVYEGKGLNMVEARRVAGAVIEHFRNHPDESLGVGTFNMRQQVAILDELERMRRDDPSLEQYFSRSAEEPFFVKNLENIQGDERDVIYLSVTYAKGLDGRLRQNFGPLNGENGWRRLNVLTTRARKRMRVFSSMRGEEINPAGATSNGPRLLREFLIYAERGVLDSITVKHNAEMDSPFEREIYSELTRKGLQLQPQVGVAGYRIDFGVLDSAVAGRFICGIECDGASYHSSETARDRDRLRQQVLEMRGWTIIRVWSTDWFKDRSGQIDRLLKLIEAARAKAREDEARQLISAAPVAVRATAGAAPVSTEKPRKDVITEPQYKRPVVPDYVVASNILPFPGTDILKAPLSYVVAAARNVVHAESPIHIEELRSRIATAWGVGRIGTRIASRLEEAITHAAKAAEIELRGEFAWRPKTPCPVRSRRSIRMHPEHVAIEEYQATIRIILGEARTLPKEELLSEVKAILGLSRSPVLASRVDEAIEQLVEQRIIGEASSGFALRS